MSTGLLCGACGKAPPKAANPPKDRTDEAAKESRRLYTGSGTATLRDTEGDRPIRYILKWMSSQLDYSQEQGALGGRLEGVSGELYQEGKLASRFTAEHATANKATNLLRLEGNVVVEGLEVDEKGKVVGKEISATLRCHRVEWNTKQKMMRAFEQVTIVSRQGTVGPLNELWCEPSVRRAGTPGFFR